MGNDKKQSYSHLWAPCRSHLGRVKTSPRNISCLILLFADYGNGPTSSLERILTGHGKDMERTCDMKEKEVDAHVTK